MTTSTWSWPDVVEAITHPADFSSFTYRLRAEAKWHDGQPVTPDDVIFSFAAFKKNNPQLSAYYHHVVKAEATGDREVTFTFAAPVNRELPQIVGQLTVLPKHWWEDTDHKRDVAATTLEPPVGSGPYRIKEFEAGRVVVYERVENYWGKNLNVRIGRDNFAELRFDYYRDWTVEFEGFKADQFDWYDEHSAKNWATGYHFPAVEDKRVILEEFPIRNVGVMQAFAFNIRRRKFKAPQLRRALNFAFDFERMNREIFYGQYKVSPVILKEPSLPPPESRKVASSKCSKRCVVTCRRRYSLPPIPILLAEVLTQPGTIFVKPGNYLRRRVSACAISSLSIRRQGNR